jgi:hypothetical protein
MATLEQPLQMQTGRYQADQYIALRDERAPYRGKWLICADAAGRFWALHDTAAEPEKTVVAETRQFQARLDASRFMRHLLLHGWSIYGQSEGNMLDQLW